MEKSGPTELAAEIVAAFVSNNSVPKGELPALIEAVHTAVKRLADGGEVAIAVSEPPAPAVSVRKSVTPDYLICLDDGRRFKSLRRHLAMLGMTPEQYRAKWNLPSDYPMVAPNYAAQRSALAKSLGLGHLRRRPVATVPPRSAVGIEAAAVPPTSADAIDAAAHKAAGVAASRAKTKGKVAVSPEATPSPVARARRRRKRPRRNGRGDRPKLLRAGFDVAAGGSITRPYAKPCIAPSWAGCAERWLKIEGF